MDGARFFWASLSRRDFLRITARGSAGLALAGALPLSWAQPAHAQGVRSAAVDRMIQHSLRYLDLETPARLLDSWVTPVELFYVRNHMAQPEVKLTEWRLRVGGEVERSLELTLADLEQFEQVTVVNTLECAGNGRAFYRPRRPGIQWMKGAVGNARFTGPRLGDVLRRAGVKPGGRHVLFDGLDTPPGRVPDFVRSIPRAKAMDGHTLLATRMNGAPLSLEHGFPVRALVPGWIGAASVKWLAEVRVLKQEFDGHFMKRGYRMPVRPVPPGGSARPEETRVLTSLTVKSIIAHPDDGSHQKLGPIRVSGAAWAGEAEVVRVDVSTDFGRTWQPARLGGEQARFAWRLWEFAWTPARPGSYLVLSRATDSRGNTQPVVPAWNPGGYLWNVIDQVRINVEA
ncbi:MAG: sulfite oxidase [Terriglobia bacterium]